MARPTKLTEDLQAELASMLAAGVPRTWAAEAVGVHRATLREWEARGEEWMDAPLGQIPKQERPYVRFAAVIRRETAKGAARYAAELARLAFDRGVPEVVRLRAIQFWLTHADREHWHPAVPGGELADGESVEVHMTWQD
jgi:hypothetical protein